MESAEFNIKNDDGEDYDDVEDYLMGGLEVTHPNEFDEGWEIPYDKHWAISRIVA